MSLGVNLGNKKELYYKNRKRYLVENLHRNLFVKDLLLDGDKTLKVLGIWSSDFLTSLESQGARSIQPKFQPVRPGNVVHLKRWTNLVPRTFFREKPWGRGLRWTRFFETFSVGPNRSIEFWTEILVELIAPLKNKNGWDDFWFCKGWCWV